MEQSVTAYEINCILFPETVKFVESHPIITIVIAIVLITIVINFIIHDSTD